LSPYQGAVARDGEFAEYDPKQAPLGGSSAVNVARGLLGNNRVGAYVAVRSGNVIIIYAHLDPSTIQVGEYVRQGQVIGEVVNDPLPNNSHLHLEVRGYGFNDPKLGEDDELTSESATPLIALNPARLFSPEYAEAMLNPGLIHQRRPNEDFDAWDTSIAAIDLGSRGIYYNTPIDPDFPPDFSSVWPSSIFREGE
jgi:murein DD-endopeptidase MepM/ murein hydrolase activator NlpD